MLILVAAVPVMAGLFWRTWISPNPPGARSETAPAASDASPFAAWRATGLTVHGKAGMAPDGTKAATKLLEGDSVDAHGLTAGINLDLVKPVTATLHAHQGQGRRLQYFLSNGGVLILQCDVDLQTGATAVQADKALRTSSCTAAAANDGWWRVEMKGAFEPNATKGPIDIGIALAPEPFQRSYEGDGKSHIFIWSAGVSQP